MKPLAEVLSGDLLSSGIFPGLDGVAGALWRDGKNVNFDNGGVRKAYGMLGLENLAARPTGIVSTLADSEARAFIGAGTKAYRYRPSDGLTDIGTFAAMGGTYQFVPWDTWALISNGVDPLELWKNTGSSAPITAPFTRANTIFKYHIRGFAGGTDNGGNIVEWSNANDIDADWTPTLLNSAGNLRLRELEGDILAAKPIGRSIGIYGSVNAGLFSYIGGTPVYGFSKPIRGVSAISPHSIIGMGDRHFGITRDNAFVTDLVSSQLIDEPAVRKWIKDNADWSRASETYGWADWANNIARWSIPLNGGLTQGIGYRVDKGTWTRFDDAVVIGEESGPFANALHLKSARLLRLDKSSPNNDGGAFSAYVQSKPMDFGERNMNKKISLINIDGTWSGNARFSLGYSDTPGGTIDWALDQALATSVFPDQYGIKNEAPFLHMKFYSDAVDANWAISGGKIYGEFTGYVS